MRKGVGNAGMSEMGERDSQGAAKAQVGQRGEGARVARFVSGGEPAIPTASMNWRMLGSVRFSMVWAGLAAGAAAQGMELEKMRTGRG